MSIGNIDIVAQYVGDGVQTTFVLPFPYYDGSTNIKAQKKVGEVITPLVYGADFTVDPKSTKAGGTATTTSPIEDGAIITFQLDLPIIQSSQYENSGNILPKSIEVDFDYGCLVDKILAAKLARAVLVPIDGGMTPEEYWENFFKVYNDMLTKYAEIFEAYGNIFCQSIVPFTTQDGVLEYETGTDFIDPDANNLLLVMENIVQQPDVAYTIIEPNKIKFAQNPTAGKKVWGISSLPFSNPDIRAIVTKAIEKIDAEGDTQVQRVADEGTKWSDLAQAWAESDTPPDPSDQDSKSAKTWASIAADTVPLASKTIAGKVQIGSNIDVDKGIISVKDASESEKGVVQLSNTASNDETTAVTPKALNEIKNVVDSLFTGGSFKTGDFKISIKDSLEGFLICDGSAVSRTTYADLFAVIGTKFGAGDGKTTFNLPDFRGRFIQGANGDLGSVKSAGLPNIAGRFAGFQQNQTDGAFSLDSGGTNPAYNLVTTKMYNLDFNASSSNPIYGASETVQPPAIALNVFIKY